MRLFIRKNADENFLFEVLAKNGVENPEIIKNSYGKPYLKSQELYFNKSHSGDLTVIATSSREIGVDIQHLTWRASVPAHAFTLAEQNLLESASAKNKQYLFTKIWVTKEAYAKMTGRGVAYGLKNIDSLQLAAKTDIIEYENYLIAVIEK